MRNWLLFRNVSSAAGVLLPAISADSEDKVESAETGEKIESWGMIRHGERGNSFWLKGSLSQPWDYRL